MHTQTVSEHAVAAGQKPDFAWDGDGVRCLVFLWGISWGSVGGRDLASARWEDITTLRKWWTSDVRSSGGPYPITVAKTYYSYTVALADGRSMTFSQTRHPIRGERKILKLGDLLETGVTRTQLPKAIEQFNAGRTISFGSVAVSRGGIAVGDQSLPWSKIKSVRILAGWFVVVTHSYMLPWKRVSVRDIPNYCVLVALVRSILTQ
jgi:hypothetical protein